MAIPGSLTHQNGVFHVSNPCATNETILKEYAERIDDKARETCTSRRIRQETRDRLYSELLALIAEGNAFATWSKQRKRFKTPDMDSLKVSVARAELAKARAEDRERKVREKRNAEQIAKLRAEWGSVLEAWKRGDVAGMIPYQFRELPEYMETAYLRVRGENVETSQGASFPVDHAVRAIRVIQRMMRNTDGNTDAPLFVRNGKTIRLGHYQVDRIDADGVIHAGCHKVSRSEFESIAQQLREQVEAISCKDSQVEEED
jgi:hypothetical protein